MSLTWKAVMLIILLAGIAIVDAALGFKIKGTLMPFLNALVSIAQFVISIAAVIAAGAVKS